VTEQQTALPAATADRVQLAELCLTVRERSVVEVARATLTEIASVKLTDAATAAYTAGRLEASLRGLLAIVDEHAPQ
jgi:hypothetical protein